MEAGDQMVERLHGLQIERFGVITRCKNVREGNSGDSLAVRRNRVFTVRGRLLV